MSNDQDMTLTPDYTDEETIQTNSRIKVKVLDLYYGDRDKLNDWLLLVDFYLKFGPAVKESNKGVLISLFLRGRALK